MNFFARACGIAAAAIALAATATYADPSIAGGTAGPASETTYLAHADATVSGLGAEPNEAGEAAAEGGRAVGEEPGAGGHALASVIVEAMQAAAAIMPGALPLDSLVDAHAGIDTQDAEQECLARAVYFEARGEPIEGQLAVAEVVLNRTLSGRYPTGICAVVTQPWQFSFIRNGRFPEADRASAAWRKAVGIARIAQRGLAGKMPSGVLWYHADYVAPSWGKRLHREAKIGLHIFYS